MFSPTASLLDLFFPRLCVLCGREGVWACPNCQTTIGFEETRLETAWPHLDTALALFPFPEGGLIRELLHNLKYNGIFEAASSLLDIVKKYFSVAEIRELLSLSGEAILIPVPSSPAKLKSRGYNQAEELAKALSTWLQFPVWPQALRRQQRTSQVGKSLEERQAQAANIYKWGGKVVPPEYIDKEWLIIDDLMTTGSTLRACAACLQPYTQKGIKALTLAYEK